MVNSYRLPVEFEISHGEVNDCFVASDLIAGLLDVEVIAGYKGYEYEQLYKITEIKVDHIFNQVDGDGETWKVITIL